MSPELPRGSGLLHAGDDRVGDLAHPHPPVHGGLLDPPEGVGLGDLQLGHQHPLGAVDRLTGLEPVAQVGDRAKGVLMAKLKITEADAFRWIQKTAMDRRMGMREVADAVVAGMEKA